ncbi:MAG: PspC domain-containing protein [Dictyoglomus sp.]|nr:PspC domain-containing protein [Dictyoglomus sp.]MCX7942156.1 PspC domain-containing protein [Dictyoglomaceae bacterium]MDW8188515.1 PspC domain-containing protein [Dictyoglomus sp.]
MEKRLYRSKKERILLGVCGGIAEYFSIDPTIVRLIFILLIFVTGPILPIFYFISALIIPEAPNGEEFKKEIDESYIEKIKDEMKTQYKSSSKEIWGWFLLGLGVLLLSSNLGWLFIPFRILVPLFILVLGIILLIKIK